MRKTTYIKGKDGKFAGSIGAGKSHLPAISPEFPPNSAASQSTPQQWTTHFSHPATWAEKPRELLIYQLPDYWGDGEVTNQDITRLEPATMLPRPPQTVIDQWPQTQAQQTLDDDLVYMTNLVSKYTRNLDDIDDTYNHATHCAERATYYRNNGQFYQAQAYEWARLVGFHSIDYLREEDPPKTPLMDDAKTISRGAVILDYLPLANYDADAAAVVSVLQN